MSLAPANTATPGVGADRRSIGFLLRVGLANAGGVIAFLPLLSLLLPMKVEAIAGEARIEVFTATVIAGACASSVSNILFGWLSDRSVAAGGGRRHWVAIGMVLLALSYGSVALAQTPGELVGAIVLFQFAVNAVLAPLFAIMADEVPDGQKGVAAGLLSLGGPVAAGISTILVAITMIGEPTRLAIVLLGVTAFVLPLLFTRSRIAAEGPESRTEARMLRGDLAIAWSARILVQFAGNVLSLYLLYYFESVTTHDPRVNLAARVGHLLTFAYLIPVPIAVLAGRFSDRTGRRKPFLLGAALFAALGLVGMAIARDWAFGAAAFGIYAIGSSIFLALHVGFAMQLLPSAAHRGRDLGILNLTNTLPSLAGPALTWMLATPDDFAPAMLALAALTACGGLAILMVRGRR